MAVISINIEESNDHIISGIPKTISLSTNLPSTIFYTLDGSEPDNFSSIYTEVIFLPTDSLSVIFKTFATNGEDTSAVITKNYFSIISDKARLPHASVVGLNNSSNNIFPFGTNAPNPSATYATNAKAGITIDTPNIENTPLGFDGSGNPSGGTDSTEPFSTYEFIFSKTDALGQKTAGVGNFPSHTTVIGSNYPEEYRQEISNRSDKLFNPKALVIFQDSSIDDPNEPIHLNRQYFSMQNQEIVSDGNTLFNSGIDNAGITGSFLRSHYNPKTNEITYYYYDNKVNRWIISKTPFEPKSSDIGNLSSMVFPRSNGGAGMVFKWIPFQRRSLF